MYIGFCQRLLPFRHGAPAARAAAAPPRLVLAAALPARRARAGSSAGNGSYPLDQSGHRVIPDSLQRVIARRASEGRRPMEQSSTISCSPRVEEASSTRATSCAPSTPCSRQRASRRGGDSTTSGTAPRRSLSPRACRWSRCRCCSAIRRFRTTADLYGHLVKQTAARAATKMDAVLRPAARPEGVNRVSAAPLRQQPTRNAAFPEEKWSRQSDLN